MFRQIRARATGKRLQSMQDVKAQGGCHGNIFEVLLLGEKESKKEVKTALWQLEHEQEKKTKGKYQGFIKQIITEQKDSPTSCVMQDSVSPTLPSPS